MREVLHMDRMNSNHGLPVPAPTGNGPHLHHQPPPQIFGAYAQDGSPIVPQDLLNYSAPLFTNDQSYLEDRNDVKRRRIARACDMCRKKKIKCNGKIPCAHCVNYKTECIFTHVERKRNPPKGAKYIEGLENRLGRMESLLRLSGLLDDSDNGRMDLGTLEKRLSEQKNSSGRASITVSTHTSPGQSTSGPDGNADSPKISFTSPDSQKEQLPKKTDVSPTEESDKEKEEEVEALSDMMCSLVTNNCGETRYIGSSSGFSIFSPKGIQWVNEKTGDSSFQQMITSAAVDDNKWVYWKPQIFGDLFARKIYKNLPPKAEAVSLLRDFFENFNCMFPLFHQPTFMHLVERQYTNHPYEGSGWWASLNVALAIAHRLRVMSHLVPQEEDESAWLYLKNAMSVFTELAMRNTDLLSIQALLGMALFLQGTPNPQPSFFLVAAAVRLSHSIGLHKRGSGFNLNPVEMEQRKRVFWIAYMLDKDICLRSGRPPAQDDDDMNVGLPSADPDDNIGNIPLSDGKGKVNLFRLMSEFATIESKVYKQLYATKATKQTDGELLNTIGHLDQLLEEWKERIPVDFRPEHEIKASHTPLILHIVVLHFAYYNCLTTIHRMSVHHGYWTSRLSNFALQGLNARPLNPRVFSSAALCVSAARASINLIKYIPQGDFACVWLILYFPVSALVTLFGNILQNPQDPRARSDVRLMDLVVKFLSMLGSDEQNGGVKRMLGVCAEFERIAKVVVEKAERESSCKRKRRGQESEEFSSLKNAMTAATSTANAAGLSTNTPSPTMVFSPPVLKTTTKNGALNCNGLSDNSPTPPPAPWVPDYGFGEGSNDYLHAGGPSSAFPDLNQYSDGCSSMDMGMGLSGMPVSAMSPLNMNTFQQPPVPQDFWNMPMTIEYDWADILAGGTYEGFENGIYGGDGGMPGMGTRMLGNGNGDGGGDGEGDLTINGHDGNGNMGSAQHGHGHHGDGDGGGGNGGGGDGGRR